MKKILYLFVMLVSCDLSATSLPREFYPIVSQQQAFHKPQVQHIREAMLLDLVASASQKAYRAKKTYMFWGGGQEKRADFKAFILCLKNDLGFLGVPLIDRVLSREVDRDRHNVEGQIDQAEKILLCMTHEMGIAACSRSYDHFEADWKRLEKRIHKNRSENEFGPRAVLPLYFDGNSLGLRGIIDESQGSVLEELKVASESYVGLLMALTRFCYDIPQEDKFEDETLNQIWQCFPGFKEVMGWKDRE